jgi:hypothetical protein
MEAGFLGTATCWKSCIARAPYYASDLVQETVRAGQMTRDVGADSNADFRLGREMEVWIKARDGVDLGKRHVQLSRKRV